MSQPGGERLTRERVLKQIAVLMNNYDVRRGGGKSTTEDVVRPYQIDFMFLGFTGSIFFRIKLPTVWGKKKDLM